MLAPLIALPHLRQQLPFDLAWLPRQAYLVGGAVRDQVLGRRRDYLDWDFVVPDHAITTARAIAEYYGAGFVVLDKTREIARVVFPQGTVDFALQEGQTLEQDLRRRDFTINAIAYNLHQDQLVDPLQGVEDIHRGVLTMISAANLADDPLRLLRAYRQAAQLQFTIEPTTRATLQDLARLIKTVAAERVQSELSYLLASPRGNSWLLAAWQDGLITPWFPQAHLGTFHRLCQIDLALANIKGQLTLGDRLKFLQLLGKKGTIKAKLACLVTQEPEIAEKELETLKYSRQEVRAVGTILRCYPYLTQRDFSQNLRQQYFFFQEIGKFLPIFSLFALVKSPEQAIVFELLHRYLKDNDPVAHPQPLLNGKELIEHLQLKPSPLIGKLLTEIQVARIEGKIHSLPEALDYAKRLLSSANNEN
ncbi:MAG: CCA tRNA nucleotidyltransferase [Merismopediaceae bacterium]|nr:CCA tRNA nucleotidyltransferase [Merismopediaceae bacterium]